MNAPASDEIVGWLEKLGLRACAQPFAENGITVAALRHLTDQDLKDIGVLLGHRRIILAAINELASATAGVPARTTTLEPKQAPESFKQEQIPITRQKSRSPE